MPDPLITCPPAPGILHEGTTPLRLLRTIKATRSVDGAPMTLHEGARLTYVGPASSVDSSVYVLDPVEPAVYVVPLEVLGVDLTDLTGRTHALDHLALLAGIKGNVTPGMPMAVPMGVLWTCLPGPAWKMQTRQCEGQDRHHRRFVAPGKGGLWGDVELTALAHIDPTHDIRLEDGSRVVDAQALAAVALHYLAAKDPKP